MKLGSRGELLPMGGFSRDPGPLPAGIHGSAWRTHDGLRVVSSLEDAYLPGSGDPPLVGPQWLVSVSRRSPGSRSALAARCGATDDDLRRVVAAFALPAFDEDNHHPGVARHLWCPVEDRYRSACECKLTEIAVVEPDGYTWTTDAGEGCRGCDYQRAFGLPCTIHAAS